jgi:hypothetical protein
VEGEIMEKRLSFYKAEITLKNGVKVKSDAVLLPNKNNPGIYQVRRENSDTFEFINAGEVKQVVLTNKD